MYLPSSLVAPLGSVEMSNLSLTFFIHSSTRSSFSWMSSENKKNPVIKTTETVYKGLTITFVLHYTPYLTLKPVSHIITPIVPIASVTSKSFLAIGVIIREQYTDDR